MAPQPVSQPELSHTGPPLPEVDPRVGLLRDFFFNRTDKLAIKLRKGTPLPVQPHKGDLLSLIQAHVLGKRVPEGKADRLGTHSARLYTGHFRIGSYAPAPDGTTRWLCLDFDGAGHRNPLKDARGAALESIQNLYARKIPCYLERSGGGHGFHVWVFFEAPVPAASARALGFKVAPRQAPLQKGGFAVPERGHGIEVFPKQEKVSPKGYGNMVYLPWWHGAKGSANQFYPVTAEGLIEAGPFVPVSFESLNQEDLDWVLADILPAPSPHSPVAGAGPTKSGPWRDWRESALSDTVVKAIYGRWLTDKETEDGWFQCRDPFSPTGDQNPSAGVATGSGQAERGTFHSFISGTTLSIFDFMVETKQAASFQDALRKIADISSVPLPAGNRSPQPEAPVQIPASHPPARNVILVDDRQFHTLIEETWATINARNRPPTLFRRAGGLALIKHKEDGSAHIEQMNETDVFGYLVRLCDWEKFGEHGNTPAIPPSNLPRDLLAFPSPLVPRLEAVTNVPLFGKTGALIASPGYNPEDLLWFEPDSRINSGAIPHSPTAEQVDAAKALLLDDLLFDFPFASDADQANYLAALFLPFLRKMVAGPTPLHVIEAPTIGSGKTMLCQLISQILTGKQGVVSTFPVDEPERRKRITSELLLGRPVIVLDNASEKQKIDSSELAALLTTTEWSDRLLGQSKMIDLPNQAVWIMTGNNPQLSMEIARRAIRIRLVPKTDQPWRRTQFKHRSLFNWVRENRSELLHAILTLIQHWIAEGKPKGTINLGSYEDWAETMGGVLGAIGVSGFLENLDSLYDDANGDGDLWAEFTHAWWEAFGPAPKKVSDLSDFCEEKNLLGTVRRDGSPRSQETRLGFALARKKDCPCGGYIIQPVRRQGKSKTAREYALMKNDGNLTPPGGIRPCLPLIPQQEGENPGTFGDVDRDVAGTNVPEKNTNKYELSVTGRDVGDVNPRPVLRGNNIQAEDPDTRRVCVERDRDNVPNVPDARTAQANGSTPTGNSAVGTFEGLTSPSSISYVPNVPGPDLPPAQGIYDLSDPELDDPGEDQP